MPPPTPFPPPTPPLPLMPDLSNTMRESRVSNPTAWTCTSTWDSGTYEGGATWAVNATGSGKLPCRWTGVALSRFFPLRLRVKVRPNENEKDLLRSLEEFPAADAAVP